MTLLNFLKKVSEVKLWVLASAPTRVTPTTSKKISIDDRWWPHVGQVVAWTYACLGWKHSCP